MGWHRAYPLEVDAKGIKGVYCDNTATAKPGSGIGANRSSAKRRKWADQSAQNRMARAELNKERGRMSAERYHETLYALSHGTK